MESIEKLESETKSLKLDIKELKRSRNELFEENEKLRNETVSKDSKITNKNENVIAELEFELEKAKQEIDNLKQQEGKLEENYTKLNAEHQTLVHQFVGLEIDLKHLKAEKEILSERTSENSKASELAQPQKAAYGDGITFSYSGDEKESKRFEVQRESYKTKIRRGESELRDHQERVQSLRRENEDLRKKSELDLSQHRDWLAARDEELTELRKQTRDKQENKKGREELENKLKVLNKELEQQKDINEGLNYQLKEKTNEFKVKIMVATKNRVDMQDKYTKSEFEKQSLQQQVERLHALIDTVKQNTDTLKYKLDDEKNRIEGHTTNMQHIPQSWSCSYCGVMCPSEQEKDDHMLNHCTKSTMLKKQVRPPLPKIPQMMTAHAISYPEGQIYANYDQPQSYGYRNTSPPQQRYNVTQQTNPAMYSYVQRPSISTPTYPQATQPWGQPPSMLPRYPPPQGTGQGGYRGSSTPETPLEGPRLPANIPQLRHISQPMSFLGRTGANSWEGDVQPGNRRVSDSQRSQNTSKW